MADVSNFDNVSADALTEAQIQGIIRRIELNIYNILAGKWDAVDYAEFGDAGHRRDGTKLLAELRQQLAFWQGRLDSLPVFEVTEWDDEAV